VNNYPCLASDHRRFRKIEIKVKVVIIWYFDRLFNRHRVKVA
jgi:hypothetical protein